VERNCEPMNKNRIEGVAEQGERAINRKALVIKVKCVNSAVVQRGMNGLLFPRNTQFVHQFIKSGSADSPFFGGLGEVVLILGKSFQDEGFFNLFLGFLEGQTSFAILGGKKGRKIPINSFQLFRL